MVWYQRVFYPIQQLSEGSQVVHALEGIEESAWEGSDQVAHALEGIEESARR